MTPDEVRIEEGLAPNDTIDAIVDAQSTGAENAAAIPPATAEPEADAVEENVSA
jgi:hypothetical protein